MLSCETALTWEDCDEDAGAVDGVDDDVGDDDVGDDVGEDDVGEDDVGDDCGVVVEGVDVGAGPLVVGDAVVKPSKILPLTIFAEPIPEPSVCDIRFKLGIRPFNIERSSFKNWTPCLMAGSELS